MFNIYPKNQAVLSEYLSGIREIGRERLFAKNELIFRSGDKVESLFYLTKGLVKCFQVHKGKEVILRLMTDGSAVLGYSGFITGGLSSEDIECLQPCSGYMVSLSEIESLRERFGYVESLLRYLAEQHYLSLERRLVMLHHKTAEERYRYFLNNMEAKIVEETPMNCVASYLGVTPESFSRMKRNLIL